MSVSKRQAKVCIGLSGTMLLSSGLFMTLVPPPVLGILFPLYFTAMLGLVVIGIINL